MGAAAAAVLLLAFLSLGREPAARRFALLTLAYGLWCTGSAARGLGAPWGRALADLALVALGPLALTCAAGLAGRRAIAPKYASLFLATPLALGAAILALGEPPPALHIAAHVFAFAASPPAPSRSRATRPRPTTTPRPTRGACATWSSPTRSRSARRFSTWRCGSSPAERRVAPVPAALPVRRLPAPDTGSRRRPAPAGRQHRGALGHGGRAGGVLRRDPHLGRRAARPVRVQRVRRLVRAAVLLRADARPDPGRDGAPLPRRQGRARARAAARCASG